MKYLLLALLTPFLFLSGCLFSEDKTAGTEDFPNTVSIAVLDGLKESDQWDQFGNINTQLPENTVKASTTPPLAKAGGAKTGSDEDIVFSAPPEPFVTDSSYWIESGDSLIQIVEKSNSSHYVIDSLIAFTGSEGDTLGVRYHSVEYSILGDLKTSETTIVDYDGDGIISPNNQNSNQAVITSSSYKLLGTDVLIIIADAGADLDFGEEGNPASEDNLILEISSFNLNNSGDSLKYFRQSDADGDGILTPVSGRKNQVVNFEFTTDLLLKTRSYTKILVDAGIDEDFGENGNEAEKDNLILQFETAVVSAEGDTISHVYAEDLDGDDIITALTDNKTNSAKYTKIIRIDNQTLRESVSLTSGPDNNFDLERDNEILSYEKLWLANNDTLLYATIMDADGDGIAFDSLSDSSIVDVYFLTKGLPPRKETKTTMVIFPRDSSLNYPVYGEVISTWTEKNYKVLKIYGTLENNWIDLKDTVFVTIETVQDDPSFTPFKKAGFKAGLGKDIYSDSDNVLYAFEFNQKNPNQEYKEIHFSFVSDEPIPSGKPPVSGNVEASLILSKEESYYFSGRLEDNNLTGTLTLPDNSSTQVSWEKE